MATMAGAFRAPMRMDERPARRAGCRGRARCHRGRSRAAVLRAQCQRALARMGAALPACHGDGDSALQHAAHRARLRRAACTCPAARTAQRCWRTAAPARRSWPPGSSACASAGTACASSRCTTSRAAPTRLRRCACTPACSWAGLRRGPARGVQGAAAAARGALRACAAVLIRPWHAAGPVARASSRLCGAIGSRWHGDVTRWPRCRPARPVPARGARLSLARAAGAPAGNGADEESLT